jgi:molybdopterin-binding protein
MRRRMPTGWRYSSYLPTASASLRAMDSPRRRYRNEGGIMKISARNKLKGRLVEVKKGTTTAHVKIDVAGQTVTAAITNEAVDELMLASGQSVYAIIKASDVMVGVD